MLVCMLQHEEERYQHRRAVTKLVSFTIAIYQECLYCFYFWGSMKEKILQRFGLIQNADGTGNSCCSAQQVLMLGSFSYTPNFMCLMHVISAEAKLFGIWEPETTSRTTFDVSFSFLIGNIEALVLHSYIYLVFLPH